MVPFLFKACLHVVGAYSMLVYFGCCSSVVLLIVQWYSSSIFRKRFFFQVYINVSADIILLPNTVVAYFVAIVLVKEVVLDERSTDKFVYFIHIPMCYSFIVFNYGQILAYSPNVVPPGHSNCGVDVGCTWNGMHG